MAATTVGFIAPATLETTTYELYTLLPDGVRLVSYPLLVNRIERDELREHEAGLDAAADALGACGVDLIGISGAPMVYTRGPGHDRVIAARVRDIAGVEALCDLTAVVDYLREAGCRRIAVASPFPAVLNDDLVSFLEAEDLPVAAVAGGPYRRNTQLRCLPAHAAFRRGLEALSRAPECDGLFINCAGWATQGAAARLRAESGLPVVTQMEALAWRCAAHDRRAATAGVARDY